MAPQSSGTTSPLAMTSERDFRVSSDSGMRFIARYRISILTLAHIFVFSFSYYTAYLLRLDFSISQEMSTRFWHSLPYVVGIEIGCFLFLRTFHGWWRHVTFRDLVSFVKPLAVSVTLIFAADIVFLDIQVPRSVLVINVLISGLLLSVLRSSWRLSKERVWPVKASLDGRRPAFMISNNFQSLVMASQINSQQNSAVKIVGILSVGKANIPIGSKRGGIPIIGSICDAPALAEKHGVDEVWLTAGAITGSKLLELKKLYDQHEISTKIIPATTDRTHGGSFIPVREIEIENLLQRTAVQLDARKIASEIAGRTVLVTGAGGSIGSEICRQLIRFNPSKIVLLDHRENSVFLIHSELSRIPHCSTTLIPAVADILDEALMAALLANHSPTFVYHAAAHKHVGLMETQPSVAVRNNITGTRKLADAAAKYGVSKFVMVSTDKAVNPTSVMGCTKQIAERYCLSLGKKSNTQFVVVRFGNVLGSNGSVVPIFKRQIQNGGPITITDARMTRFFMTIPEASQLVLQAGAMGEGGEIFVLDMGEQVKIVDLARKMIELAGLPLSAIGIEFVGARPGEKLYEELYFEEEEMIATDHATIFAANHRALEHDEVLESIVNLETVAIKHDGGREVCRLLKKYIPEYAFQEVDSREGSESPTWNVPAPKGIFPLTAPTSPDTSASYS